MRTRLQRFPSLGKLITVCQRLVNPGGAGDGAVEWMCGGKGSETADAGAPSTLDGKTAAEELVLVPANHPCAQLESCGSRDCLL